jgi:gas vesicle protein
MKVTLGIIAGIAVGVGIGLLIAPEKGSETRRKLVDSAGDWMEQLKNSLSTGEEEESSDSSSKSHQRTPQTT